MGSACWNFTFSLAGIRGSVLQLRRVKDNTGTLILTGEQVVRDMFYDGRPELEPGARTAQMAADLLTTRSGSHCLPALFSDHSTGP